MSLGSRVKSLPFKGDKMANLKSFPRKMRKLLNYPSVNLLLFIFIIIEKVEKIYHVEHHMDSLWIYNKPIL